MKISIKKYEYSLSLFLFLITAVVFFSFVFVSPKTFINEALADTCYVSAEYETPQCAPDGVENAFYGGDVTVYLDGYSGPLGNCPPGDECNITFTSEQKQQLLEDLAAQNQQKTSANQTNDPEAYNPCGSLDLACNLVYFLHRLIDAVLGLPLRLAQNAFQWAMCINTKSFGGTDSTSCRGGGNITTTATIGWGAVRDVANMFFVFFLLWIAIATIFGFEQYGIRSVLPKLIAVALLINFSLPITTFFINTTNALASTFYNSLASQGGINSILSSLDSSKIGAAAASYGKPIPPPPPSQFSFSRLLEGLTTQLRRAVVVNKDDLSALSLNADDCLYFQKYPNAGMFTGFDKSEINLACSSVFTEYTVLSNEAVAAASVNTDFGGRWIDYALKIIVVKLIFYPISIFVIFAGAIMLFIRVIALSFLIVLAPLAFLFMIMPATQQYYGQWWNSLLKWSFFFPAFTFFLWLSMVTVRAAAITVFQQQGEMGVADLFINFFLAVGFMLGSLIVSQQLGIAFAGTAMSMGKRWTTGARRWAVNRSVGRIKEGGKEALRTGGGRAFTEAMGKIPIVGRMAQRGLGRAEAAGATAEKERLQRTFGFARRLPVEERSKYIMGLERKQKKDVLEAAGGAERDKLVQELSGRDQEKLIDQLRGLGADHLVTNATNNPEVTVHGEHPEMQKGTLEYQKQVREETKRFADKGELSPEFMESGHFREYLKEEGTQEDLQQIFVSTNSKVREQMAGFLRDIYQGAEQEAKRASEEVAAKPGLPGEAARKMAAGQAYKETYEKELQKSLSQDALKYTSGSPQMRVIAGYGVPYERMQKKEREKIEKEVDFFAEAIHRAAFDIDDALNILDKFKSPEMQKKINASSFVKEAREIPLQIMENAHSTGTTREVYDTYLKMHEVMKKILEEETKKK